MTKWVLGLDGGGTKTILALADTQGNIRGLYRTEGINPFDQPRWREILKNLLETRVPEADDVAHASFGIAGYGEVSELTKAQEETVRSWAGNTPVTVMNDVQVALIGALLDKPGVLILAGTGSMAWGRDDKGNEVRVGGWGEWLGDEGSAFWIGIEALRKVTWALDGRLEDQPFARSILEAIGAKDGDELLRWFYGLEHVRSSVARIAPVVDGLAEQGNPTSQAILRKATELLAAHVRTAQRQLELSSPTFSYAGGLFKSQTMREQLKAYLSELGSWQEPALPPLGGALWHAAVQAGWKPSETWIERVNTTLTASDAT